MTCIQTLYSTENPLNREPDLKDLISNFITPIHPTPNPTTTTTTTTTNNPDSSLLYDRNHGPIPILFPSNSNSNSTSHVLHINGLVPTPLSLTAHDLRTQFPQHEVTAALQCAGNRRHTMRKLLKEVQGVDWGDSAVMNCRWRGVRVRDLLGRAGVDFERMDAHPGRDAEDGDEIGDLHVAFSCSKVPTQDDSWFGGSVGLARCCAVDSEAIVALEMNSSPLPFSHGYPMRAVLPGIVGARWVKWLDTITVQDHESTNHYQRRDYKILPPQAVDGDSAGRFWESTPAMQETVVNSAVGVPRDGDLVYVQSQGQDQGDGDGDGGWVEVRGYAVPGGACGPVVKVEVSGDGGGRWVEAEIQDGDGEGVSESKWCWVLWRAQVWMSRGEGREVLCRATDRGGNVQREHSQWNLRGVGYNGYGRSRGLVVR